MPSIISIIFMVLRGVGFVTAPGAVHIYISSSCSDNLDISDQINLCNEDASDIEDLVMMMVVSLRCSGATQHPPHPQHQSWDTRLKIVITYSRHMARDHHIGFKYIYFYLFNLHIIIMYGTE